MLEISDVHFRYGRQRVLERVDLTLAGGEILALLGPNGAGKSTLVSLITGARRVKHGRVELDGRKPIRREVRRRIGWVPQNVTLFPRLTVEENMRAAGQLLGVRRSQLSERVEVVLAQVGLSGKRRKLAGTLSGGQQRLLNVGLGLVHNPVLLVLDEPTAGVDSAAREHLKRTLWDLRSQGLAILLTTHELDDADQLADRLAILVDGKIIASGTTGDVIRQYFESNREVSITLSGDQRFNGALGRCGQLLHCAGLVAEPESGNWRGLLANDSQQVEELVQQVLHHGALVRDLRVRSPSLDLLMRKIDQTRTPQ